jgi:hypothetical protein
LFHPVPVWLLWLKYRRRLDFVALTIGSVIPDFLEPVFLLGFQDLYWTHRDLSHSILGALTYDLVLTLVACRFVVRPFLGWLDRVRPSPLWNRFGGLDYREPKPRGWTVVSAAIGTLAHPLSDLPFHAAVRTRVRLLALRILVAASRRHLPPRRNASE